MIPDHSSTTLANNSLNASSAGTSRKLYDDELDPSEEYINECDQSGIQMMTFRSTEIKGIICDMKLNKLSYISVKYVIRNLSYH